MPVGFLEFLQRPLFHLGPRCTGAWASCSSWPSHSEITVTSTPDYISPFGTGRPCIFCGGFVAAIEAKKRDGRRRPAVSHHAPLLQREKPVGAQDQVIEDVDPEELSGVNELPREEEILS